MLIVFVSANTPRLRNEDTGLQFIILSVDAVEGFATSMAPDASDPDESSSEESGSTSSSRHASPSPSLLERYNASVCARLDLSTSSGDSAVVKRQGVEDDGIEDDESHTRPMTKAEKQNAKKKRRKEREKATRAQGASIDVPTSSVIRLFSNQSVKSVSLVPPSQNYETPVNPRHRPLPAVSVERISKLASEAADSASARDTWETAAKSDGRAKKIRHVSVTQSTTKLPSAALIRVSPHIMSSDVTAPPPIQNTGAVPVLPVVDTAVSSPGPRRKRKQRIRRPPAYYRPAPTLGGKSLGYAYGF